MPYSPPAGAFVGLRLATQAVPAGQFVGLLLGVAPDPPPTRTAPSLWAGPGAPWAQVPTRHIAAPRVRYGDAGAIVVTVAAPHQQGVRTSPVLASAWLMNTRRSRVQTLPHAQLRRESATVRGPWVHVARLAREAASPWHMLQPRTAVLASAYLHPERRAALWAAPWRDSERRTLESATPYSYAPQHARRLALRWGDAASAAWAVLPEPVDPPEPPTPSTSGRYVGLHLACPLHTGGGAHVPLLLGRVTCAHLYPRRKVYHVLNSASVVRLPDRAPIHASAVSLSIDISQFCWSLSLDLSDAASFALLRPASEGQPREIEVTINGYVWTAVVDGFDEGAGWSANTWRVNGRSRAAYLAEPYAPKRSRVVELTRTAQQLAAVELELTDWALDWTAVDWLVPAGVHTVDRQTPIAAIQRIAASVGAFVHADRVDDVLHVRPVYPYAPWAWSVESPVVVLLPDYTLSRSGRFEGGTRPELAIVRGERAGVQTRVLRAGTAGAVSAGVFVDPLITTHAAGAARGMYELARIGPRQSVELETPLSSAGGGIPGLVEPGQLVLCEGAEPFRAVTTGCRISAQRNGAALRVRQTIAVERHYDYP